MTRATKPKVHNVRGRPIHGHR